MIPPRAEFYVDINVAEDVATLLRASGHDVVTARELRRQRATDDEHLLAAADAARIFITHNEEDFILLHDAWLRWFRAKNVPAQHGGLIIVPQGQRYGLNWTPELIARELLTVIGIAPQLSNELILRKSAGWLRRDQGRWMAWP